MNNKISNVLNKIIDSGYEAYVVGGFIRDYLLGLETYDVDIATNAEPKKIKEIFDLSNDTKDNYGSVLIKDKLYNYDITTYRKEYGYLNRKPERIEFINDIETDIKRRDFTINALYMDVNGNIHDLVDGKKDLENKIIRIVGSIDEKMIEDPLRMLRAIRFSSNLNFQLENNLKHYIMQNKQLIQTLSYTRKKEELDKIFKNQNKLKGVELIKELNLSDILEIEIPDNLSDCSNPLGIWAQIKISDNYQFSNAENDIIEKVRKILNYGIIDNIVLYEYGLYASIIAGEILGINRSYISDIYKNMPIYSQKDIKINGEDIINILSIEPGSKIKEILFDIELNILNSKLNNTKEELINYIKNNWR